MTIVRPYLSTRPMDHADRRRCTDFAGKIPGIDKLDPVILALYTSVYLAPATAYSKALAANNAAHDKVDTTSKAVVDANAALEIAFLAWVWSIDTAVRKKGFAAAELQPHLSKKTIGVFLAGEPWDKLHDLDLLWNIVATTPVLVGDAIRLKEVKAATDAYEAAVSAAATALDHRGDTSKALVTASTAFDKAWGLFVKGLRFHDPEGLGAHVPEFRRRRTKVAGDPPVDAAEGTDPSEPDPTDESEPTAEPIEADAAPADAAPVDAAVPADPAAIEENTDVTS